MREEAGVGPDLGGEAGVEVGMATVEVGGGCGAVSGGLVQDRAKNIEKMAAARTVS